MIPEISNAPLKTSGNNTRQTSQSNLIEVIILRCAGRIEGIIYAIGFYIEKCLQTIDILMVLNLELTFIFDLLKLTAPTIADFCIL